MLPLKTMYKECIKIIVMLQKDKKSAFKAACNNQIKTVNFFISLKAEYTLKKFL